MRCIYGDMYAHPLMKFCNEPQLCLQVGSVFLRGDVAQEVFMSHSRRHEYVPLILPWLLVLHKTRGLCLGPDAFNRHFGKWWVLCLYYTKWQDPACASHMTSFGVTVSRIFQKLYISICETSRSPFNDTFHCWAKALTERLVSFNHLNDGKE